MVNPQQQRLPIPARLPHLTRLHILQERQLGSSPHLLDLISDHAPALRDDIQFRKELWREEGPHSHQGVPQKGLDHAHLVYVVED
eukprot:CAMPEP_0206219728 /NCGR_PEP_ID=MMETSP0047_2-20121206/4470_1 /ASSEMBLY_ACC=CAM_ASM_000192 /TAXON_ID=195065 /ORGANISM="Chroomonas mesostigmatica_cf, Strain CCMP1168" /LENGTH=84 /DNA_ID=CAMNT_0053642283 /DNA_START=422 /DNA_END=673 /DNA_ORIENTATION=-